MRSPDRAKRNPGTAAPIVLQHALAPDCAGQEPGSIRATVVATARSWIGTPYRHQGALKGIGCDCLGLILGVWRELGGEEAERIPPYTPDWAEAMGRETFAEGLRKHLSEIEPGEAREGDIVLFRWRAHLPAKHAAILTAPSRMVHAQEGTRAAEAPLSEWWRRRMAYAFSLAGDGSYPFPSLSPQSAFAKASAYANAAADKSAENGGGEGAA